MTEPEDVVRLMQERDWERRERLMRSASRALWASFGGTVAFGAVLVWLWLR